MIRKTFYGNKTSEKDIKMSIISIMLVISWALIIFCFSNINSSASNTGSKSIIYIFVDKASNITHKNLTEEEKQDMVNMFNYPVRKLAHATEYFILAILIVFLLINLKVKSEKIFLVAFIVCFLYACTDEFHQTFIEGRTGQFKDVLVDSCGALFGCFTFSKIKTRENDM